MPSASSGGLDVRELDSSEWFQAMTSRYRELGPRKVTDLWNWCLRFFEIGALSSVGDPHVRTELLKTKMFIVMSYVILDDMADVSHLVDSLDRAIAYVEGFEVDRENESDRLAQHRGLLEYGRLLRRHAQRRIDALPAIERYRALVGFDIHSMFHTLRHGLCSNSSPYSTNWTEYEAYQPPAFPALLSLTLDLAGSPDFPEVELAAARRLGWWSSAAGNLGNSLSTWRREVYQHDLSSAVLLLAVEQELVSPREEPWDPASIIARIDASEILPRLQRAWDSYFELGQEAAAQITGFDAKRCLDVMKLCLSAQMSMAGAGDRPGSL
jgi:hypothetical protein